MRGILATSLALLGVVSACGFDEREGGRPNTGTIGVDLCLTLDCNDGIACTQDTCANNECVHTPRNLICDDGRFCNGSEVCSVDIGCTTAAAPPIDDGIACTIDSCDEATDTVTHTIDNSICSTNCVTGGSCDPSVGCVGGTSLADDGIPCTDDFCDELTGAVTHVPRDTLCIDDGLFCNGVPVCDAALGCTDGGPLVLSDGIACTDDVCNELTDTVDHIANDGNCSDGLSCSTDICDPALDCQVTGTEACLCNTPIFDNGDFSDTSILLNPPLGNFTANGILDEFTLPSASAFCSVTFSVAFASNSIPGSPPVVPTAAEVQIFELGVGGVAGLGNFAAATPLFSETFEVADESLFVESTAGNVAGVRVHRFQGGNSSTALPAGDYAIYVRFPAIATGTVASLVSAPQTGSGSCAHFWGDTIATPDDACVSLGAAAENIDFKVNTE